MLNPSIRTEGRGPGLLRCGRTMAGLLACALLVVYAGQLHATGGEVLHFVAGCALLWGPFAALLYGWLPHGTDDRLERLTLAALASFALTTLGYFGCATLGLRPLFYGLQIVAGVMAVLRVIRVRRAETGRAGLQFAPLLRAGGREAADGGPASQTIPAGRAGGQVVRGTGPLDRGPTRTAWPVPDGILLLLVAASLLATLRYKVPFATVPGKDGQQRIAYVLWADQLYWTGLAYQLAQAMPPPQCSARGGAPERAYHHFSQVTCVLLAAYTGQPDRLRVQLAYRLTVIEVLLCLALFSLARRLTGERWPGYVAVALMYLLPGEGPELIPNCLHVYYFTILPQATSGLIPLECFNAHTYSCLVVLYGVVLWAIQAWRGGPGAAAAAAVAGLMAAAAMRFQATIFLVLFPGTLLLTMMLGWRLRQIALAVAAAVSVLVAAALFLEMKHPAYLGGTAAASLGYNALADWDYLVKDWPLADSLLRALSITLPDGPVLRWAREAVVASGFCIFNIIGLPLVGATALCLASPDMRRRFGLPGTLLVAMAAASVVLGMVFQVDYFHETQFNRMIALYFLVSPRWFLLPFAPAALWLLGRSLQRRWSRPWFYSLVGTLAAVLLVCRLAAPPCGWWDVLRTWRVVFEPDEWQALAYLREHTPSRAVILTNRYLDQYNFVISGLTGRAAYVEAANYPVDTRALRLDPSDDRAGTVRRLWACTDEATFQSLLLRTPVDYVLEFADQPLKVRPPSCLAPVWVGPTGQVRVWAVQRAPSANGETGLERCQP